MKKSIIFGQNAGQYEIELDNISEIFYNLQTETEAKCLDAVCVSEAFSRTVIAVRTLRFQKAPACPHSGSLSSLRPEKEQKHV